MPYTEDLVTAMLTSVPESATARSWLLVSSLRSGSDPLDLQAHVMTTGIGPVRTSVALRDPRTGDSLRAERLVPDEPTGATVEFAGADLHWTGRWRGIELDLHVDCSGPVAQTGTPGDRGVPRAPTTGTVTIGTRRYPVDGTSWFDGHCADGAAGEAERSGWLLP